MARENVESRVIEGVDYDDIRQHLDIEFTSGRIYRYLEVSRDIYEAFMAADSKGRFYNDHIRDVYLYERLN